MLYKSKTDIINIQVRQLSYFVNNYFFKISSVQSAIQDLAIKHERDMCTLVNQYCFEII